MQIANPTTFQYGHENFGDGFIKAALNSSTNNLAGLLLQVEAPDGRKGEAQIQMADNGNVVIRIHLTAANPIHVLILDDTGTILEQ